MTRVKVNDGILEGEVLDSELGYTYYSFKGIPFAAPPVGDLRFKAPQPVEPWTGVRQAKDHGSVCHQFNIFFGTVIEGKEDCLYLNVYTKKIKPKKPLPVMVWIHGGGFKSGSGNSDFYGPDFLLDKDVILVTFNYRLEVLGFLSLDIEEAPGNAGMKDQVAALRWVQKNIQNFGGDPENVTIFGESAGGRSVSFHLISPMSKGLFKRAIIQSGSLTASWAVTSELKERAIVLAQQMGKHTDDNKELLDFFKSQPYQKLIATKAHISYAESVSPFIEVQWTIAPEKQFGDKERFFYGDSYDQLRSNGIHEGVDVVIGYTADEGILNIGSGSLDNIITKSNTFLECFVPKPIAWNSALKEQLKIGKKIKEFYYGKKEVSLDNLGPIIRFSSMYMFIYNIMQMVKMICSKRESKVFLYKFNCYSERNVFGPLFSKELKLEEGAVCHCDDLMYLFPMKIFNLPIVKGSKSYKMIEHVTTLWTNFAKYGNPTPDNSLKTKWLPYSLDNEDYLEIDEKLALKTSPDKEELEFMESIYKQHLPQHFWSTKKSVILQNEKIPIYK